MFFCISLFLLTPISNFLTFPSGKLSKSPEMVSSSITPLSLRQDKRKPLLLKTTIYQEKYQQRASLKTELINEKAIIPVSSFLLAALHRGSSCHRTGRARHGGRYRIEKICYLSPSFNSQSGLIKIILKPSIPLLENFKPDWLQTRVNP